MQSLNQHTKQKPVFSSGQTNRTETGLTISTSKFLITNLDHLVYFIVKLINSTEDLYLSKRKLQIGLYLVWANYAACYGQRRTEILPVDELDEYVAFRYLDAVPEELELLPEFLFPAEFQAWKECTVIPDVLEKHSSGFYNQAPPGYDETKLFQTNKHPIFREVKSFVMRYFTDRVCKSTDLSLVTRILMDDAWRDTYRKGEGERQVIPADLITKHYLRYHRV